MKFLYKSFWRWFYIVFYGLNQAGIRFYPKLFRVNADKGKKVTKNIKFFKKVIDNKKIGVLIYQGYLPRGKWQEHWKFNRIVKVKMFSRINKYLLISVKIRN